MTVMEKSQLLGFLEGHSQETWNKALAELSAAMHPVDREATRIWFAFWPLELHEALSDAKGAKDMARIMDLEGKWTLSDQLDASVGFLYGAHYWSPVKKAIVALDQASGLAGSLSELIRTVARDAAASAKQEESLLLGISAVGLMALRQLGAESLQKVADLPAAGDLLAKSPDRIVAQRERDTADGVLGFLRGVNRRWLVRWDETRRGAFIRAINGQDLAMAGANEASDFRSMDYRRVDGPIPVECRTGSCGYCWVGVVGGREKLSAISEFERERLSYFGYDTSNEEGDAHPPVRLACQATCAGDVTLAIAPWNGELKRRHDHGREKLGTS